MTQLSSLKIVVLGSKQVGKSGKSCAFAESNYTQAQNARAQTSWRALIRMKPTPCLANTHRTWRRLYYASCRQF
ncbi:unnamed protein product [Ixodes persulcatus]